MTVYPDGKVSYPLVPVTYNNHVLDSSTLRLRPAPGD
jgi:hypothetical protein